MRAKQQQRIHDMTVPRLRVIAESIVALEDREDAERVAEREPHIASRIELTSDQRRGRLSWRRRRPARQRAIREQKASKSFGQSPCSAVGLLFCKRFLCRVHSRPSSSTRRVAFSRLKLAAGGNLFCRSAPISTLARAFRVMAGSRWSSDLMSSRRYALYVAPPTDSDLWRFGCEVIGRDALTGDALEGFAPEGHEPEAWRALTSDPRRYGFHATLKAPFHLRADLDVVDLMDHVAAFARTLTPFDAGELHPGAMATDDGRAFVVLKPRGQSKSLRSLEEATVRAARSGSRASDPGRTRPTQRCAAIAKAALLSRSVGLPLRHR